MTRSNVTRLAGSAAAVLFTLGAALEIARIFTGKRFPGIVLPASYVLAAVFAALWLAAATSCVLRRRRLAAVAVVGSLAFIPHSVLQRLHGVPNGLVSLGVFAFLIVLVRLAFLGSLNLGRVEGTGDARHPTWRPPSSSSSAAT